MRRAGCVSGIAAVAALLWSGIAAGDASMPFAPYDGTNPFVCELQNVGTGTDFPHPNADPFCVEFDKTQQNVTDFGIAEFFLNEPARTAAAAPKCFYYQRDHWTGSIVQGGQPEAWHWDGSYFFDKAKGIGGVNVKNFRIGGQPADPGPYAPPQFQPYMESGGGGGGYVTLESDPDPQCIAKVDTPAERAKVYKADKNAAQACSPPGGELRGRRLGWAKLGRRRSSVTHRYGPPDSRKRRIERWCLIGAAQMRLKFRGNARRIAGAMSTSQGHRYRDIGPGSRLRKAKRKLALSPFCSICRQAGTQVFQVGGQQDRHLFLGARNGKIRWIAIVDPATLGDEATEQFLKRAGS